ncbi:MAG TPA: SPOR domain-containing protein [Stellaceae bacterium]
MAVDPAGHESPRQRRQRIFTRQRTRRRMLVIAVAAGVVVGLAGVWALYPSGKRTVASTEVPLLRADEQPTKKRPSDPGGMEIPEQDSIVLNRSEPKVEQLLPPPETPMARPAPAEPPAPAPGPGAATPAPSSAQPGSEPPSSAAAPAPAPPAPPAAAAPPAPTPSAPERTARAAAPPPPVPAGKGYRLQLGSVRTPDRAKAEWERLKREQGDLLGSLAFTAARADLGERGIFYRIQAGPIADAAAAERQCNELKRRGVGCILVKP